MGDSPAMTPEGLREGLRETLARAEEQLCRAEKIYRDSLLVVARLRSMGDIMFLQTGNREYVTKLGTLVLMVCMLVGAGWGQDSVVITAQSFQPIYPPCYWYYPVYVYPFQTFPIYNTVPEDVPAVALVEHWVTRKDLGTDDTTTEESFKAACLLSHRQYSAEKEACLLARFTCDDKERILQHDEQEPPKYWCHMPIRPPGIVHWW